MTTRTETLDLDILQGNKSVSNIWMGIFLLLSLLGVYGVGNIWNWYIFLDM